MSDCSYGHGEDYAPISQYTDDTSLVLTSDESIRVVFETFAQFEAASGAKLNRSKFKGLWLGAWSGRSNPPVALDWSSAKLMTLGVFISHGNLEEDNWRPRIDAVDHVLTSWRSRSLTFCGKALFINALALSRVWYVASLVHVPAWVEKELSHFVFSFFWSGKRELVSRSTVVQPHLFGRFSVVNVKFKVFALLGQWVKKFASSPSGWSSFMSFWFSSSFGVPLTTVLSRPFSFDPRVMQPFYSSLLFAWRRLNGSFSTPHNSLAVGVSSPLACTPVAGVSTRSCYLYLLSENMVQPHCVDKFSFTARLARYMAFPLFLRRRPPRHRPELEVGTWRAIHVRAMPVPLACFCGPTIESLDHLFYYCPLAQSVLSWLQWLLFSFFFMCPALLVRHVRFGFSSDELCVTPRVFVYLLNLCKFYIWQSRNNFHFHNVPPALLTSSPK